MTDAQPQVDTGQLVAIKSQINIADTAQITSFGEKAQQDVAGFADRILQLIQGRMPAQIRSVAPMPDIDVMLRILRALPA